MSPITTADTLLAPAPAPAPVTVIGLGAMGRAVAGAFVAAGHPTTVWNRTAGRAVALITAGALEASTLATAFAPGRVVVICVLDRAAVDAILDSAGEHLSGATIVNLTSSTPDDARAVAERVTAAGGRYLDGTIMVPTNIVGSADGSVLYSGDIAVHAEHAATLQSLGAGMVLLGDDPGLAAAYDLAMLDIFFNGMAAFLHATALVATAGVAAETFTPFAQQILDVLRASVEGLAADVDAGVYPGVEDNLEMEQAFLDHIVTMSAAHQLDTSLPTTVKRLVDAAISAGHGRDGFSRIVELLRPTAVDSAA